MGRSPHRLLLAGVLLSCGLGCQRSPLSDGLPAEFDCSSCHGSPDNAAPRGHSTERPARAISAWAPISRT